MLKSFWKSTKKNDNTKNNRETSNSLKKKRHKPNSFTYPAEGRKKGKRATSKSTAGD